MKKAINILSVITALCLIASCSKKEQPVSGSSSDEIRIEASLADVTKASLVTSENITSRRIHLDGFTTNGTTHTSNKHLDANALYDNGGWVFYTTIKDVHYYWPQHSNLDIFAYSPVSLTNTCCSVERTPDFHNKLTCTNLPMVNTSEAAGALEEFVCVEKNNCTKTDSPVALQFKRPFSVVNFKLKEAVRCDLNYIRITGIYNSGSLDCSADSWMWVPSGDTTSFVCNVNKNYPSEINNESPLGGPFIMIPQSLRKNEASPVYMEFNYKTVGNDKPTTTYVKLGTSSGSSGTVVELWKPGYNYTYYVSLLGAAGEVKMSIVCEEWASQGNSETIVQ